MSGESKEYTLRLAMVGGKPVVTGLNEIGAAGEKNLGKVKASGDLASLALEGLQQRLAFAVKGAFLTGLSIAAKKAFGDVNDLAETAERLKTSTDKLQEYQALAREVREDQGFVNQMLFDFAEKLGAAQLGTGKLAALFKEYHIELKDGRGVQRSWEEVLRDVADRIKDAGSAQERLNLATKFLGEEAGKTLLPVLEEGAAGFDRVGKAAREAGDIIEKKHIEAVHKLNDALKEIANDGWTGFKKVLAGDVYEIGKLLDILGGKARDLQLVFETLGRMRMGQDGSGAARDAMVGRIADGQVGWLKDISKMAGEDIRKFRDSQPTGGGGGGGAEADKAADKAKKLTEALRFQVEQLQRTNEQQVLYNNLKEAGVSLDSKQGQEIKKLTDRFNALEAAKKKDEEQTKKNKEAARDLGLTFVSAFEDAIVEGKNFSDVLKGLEQDIIRIMMRKMVTEPFAQAAGSWFEGLDFGKIFGGGGSVGFSSTQGIAASIYHKGGLVGPGGATRMVPASTFLGAPRFHGGGGFGLKSNERAAILEDGERVLTRNQQAGAGGVNLEVRLVNETGVPMEQTKRKGANGMTEIVLRRMVGAAVNSHIAGGGADNAMGSRFGAKPMTSKGR